MGHGCDINKETNMLEPVWSEGPTLPQSLADLVHDPVEQQDDRNMIVTSCTRTCQPLMMNLKISSRDLNQLGTT